MMWFVGVNRSCRKQVEEVNKKAAEQKHLEALKLSCLIKQKTTVATLSNSQYLRVLLYECEAECHPADLS